MVFLAQAIFEKRPWAIQGYCQIYSFAQPRCGDQAFSTFMSPYANDIFQIIYNNDLIPRLPPLQSSADKYIPPFLFPENCQVFFDRTYVDPPGHLIFINGTSGRVSINPPNGLPGIKVIEPFGILDPNVIRGMREESWIRIVLRFMFPFFVNDHFSGDYIRMLKYIKDVDEGKRGKRW
jgi:hypothetical protein